MNLSFLPPAHRKLLSIYILVAVFVAVNFYLDPMVFRSWDRFCTLSLQFAPLMICAMAQAAVMLTGGIDLSLGVTLSMMTAILATTMGSGPGGILFSVVLALAAGVGVGLVMGSVITFGRLPAIIVTLAFSYVWKGVALYILPVPGGNIPTAFSRFMSGADGIPGAAITVVLCLVGWKLFKNTRAGLALYATGDNAKAAYANGVNIVTARISAYIVSGMLMAVAGMLLVAQMGSGDPNVGLPYQMNSIAAAVLGGVSFLGGVGQMKGAVFGAFIITSLINILFFSGISAFYQYIVQGAILIVAIGVKAIGYYRNGGEE
ncbi:MAG: ABC transporter permease [Planctomycetaceae bacterium]|nr:ABC transporter permease [Planctomycetaceae bacterium]